MKGATWQYVNVAKARHVKDLLQTPQLSNREYKLLPYGNNEIMYRQRDFMGAIVENLKKACDVVNDGLPISKLSKCTFLEIPV